jgi:hypothetical protein
VGESIQAKAATRQHERDGGWALQGSGIGEDRREAVTTLGRRGARHVWCGSEPLGADWQRLAGMGPWRGVGIERDGGSAQVPLMWCPQYYT